MYRWRSRDGVNLPGRALSTTVVREESKMFNKLKEQLKALYESDECRFRKECKLYKKGSAVCNSWIDRFPTYDKAYCGKYREMEGKSV